MTEARQLLDALRRAGLLMHVREDGALVLGPRSRLTDELREQVRRLKPALAALLAANGAESSQVIWVCELAAMLAATAPAGGWPVDWRAELGRSRPALLRRVERAEESCQALMERLSAGGDTHGAWSQALREFEVVMLDVRAELLKRAADAARAEAWA
jgi:hypothetical protein